MSGWDLEYNKVIRHYHGHLSAVFALALHPILDVLITGGRDSVARVRFQFLLLLLLLLLICILFNHRFGIFVLNIKFMFWVDILMPLVLLLPTE